MWSGKKNNYERLGYDEKYSYFNAGVLVINLDYWRRENMSELCTKYILENKEKLIFNDQDVLNALLYDKKVFIPFRYNVQDGFLRRKRKIRKGASRELDIELKSPVIIHYTGSKKPWHYNSLNPYRHLYFRYLDMTRWQGWRPEVPFSYKMKMVLDKCLFALHLKEHRYRKQEL